MQAAINGDVVKINVANPDADAIQQIFKAFSDNGYNSITLSGNKFESEV